MLVLLWEKTILKEYFATGRVMERMKLSFPIHKKPQQQARQGLLFLVLL